MGRLLTRLKRRRPEDRPTAAPPQRLLPGEETETEAGPVQRWRRRFPASRTHGTAPVADFLHVGEGLAALAGDPRLAELEPGGALFIDTETTGLAGGTGTLPFLIGVGWIERDGGFVVEQLLCRQPGEERAQLTLLSSCLARATSLVSFNGRAFDMPLINTRYVMNRLRNPGAALPHLDLLHVARRIFSRRLADRSLGNLESAVLGFEREGDIPGHMIPGVYAAFLRGAPTDQLERVLEHNALDLLALAALGGVLERMYTDPDAVEHAADHLGLARAARASGQPTAAAEHLERAAQSSEAPLRIEALAMAADAARRDRDYDRSYELWLAAAQIGPEEPRVHLALAKLLEHRRGDLAGALTHARKTAGAEGEEGMRHRVARLERRLARLAERQ